MGPDLSQRIALLLPAGATGPAETLSFEFKYRTPYFFYDGSQSQPGSRFPQDLCMGTYSIANSRMTLRLLECEALDLERSPVPPLSVSFEGVRLEDIDGLRDQDYSIYSQFYYAFGQLYSGTPPGLLSEPPSPPVPVLAQFRHESLNASVRRLPFDGMVPLNWRYGKVVLKHDRFSAYVHPTVIGTRPIAGGRTADLLKCGEGSVRLLPCTTSYLINDHQHLLPALNACARLVAAKDNIENPSAPITARHWGIYNPASSHAHANAIDLTSIQIGAKTYEFERAWHENERSVLNYVNRLKGDIESRMEQYELDYTAGKIAPVEFIEFWEPFLNCLSSRMVTGVAGPWEVRGISYRFYIQANSESVVKGEGGALRFLKADPTVSHINHLHLSFDLYDCSNRSGVAGIPGRCSPF